MKAIKGNKSYTVNTESEANAYLAQGYDVYDDNGTLKEYGVGKTVPLEKFSAVEKENAKLKAELKKLKSSSKKE